MSEVKKITLKNGQSIWVEVDEVDLKAVAGTSEKISDLPKAKGTEPTGAKEEILDAMQILKDNISVMAAATAESLKEHGPDEWGIELHMGFKGKAGIPVILSGEASGGIKVTATWRKQK